jgi:hypothetical protein
VDRNRRIRLRRQRRNPVPSREANRSSVSQHWQTMSRSGRSAPEEIGLHRRMDAEYHIGDDGTLLQDRPVDIGIGARQRWDEIGWSNSQTSSSESRPIISCSSPRSAATESGPIPARKPAASKKYHGKDHGGCETFGVGARRSSSLLEGRIEFVDQHLIQQWMFPVRRRLVDAAVRSARAKCV